MCTAALRDHALGLAYRSARMTASCCWCGTDVGGRTAPHDDDGLVYCSARCAAARDLHVRHRHTARRHAPVIGWP